MNSMIYSTPGSREEGKTWVGKGMEVGNAWAYLGQSEYFDYFWESVKNREWQDTWQEGEILKNSTDSRMPNKCFTDQQKI